MTTRAGDLKLYYPNCLGTSDGQAITAFTTEYGTSTTQLVCTDIDQADDYWNDAVVKGLGIAPGYTTGDLIDQWNHVKDFANTGGIVTLATALPVNPGAGEDFYLIHMGKAESYRSSLAIPGLTATDPSDVTGIDIDFVSYSNGEGVGRISYTNSSTEMAWQAPSGVLGASVPITGIAGSEYTLYSSDDTKFIRISRNADALPTSDELENITLTQPTARVIPNTDAFQSESTFIRYIAIFIKNEHATDGMNELKAYLSPRVTASTTASADFAHTDEAVLSLTDATDFPSASFWVYNSTKDDCRYVKYRSGNSLYCVAYQAGYHRGKTAQNWSSGDTIQVWTDVDLAVPTLTGNKLPASLSGLTYSAPMSYSAATEVDNPLAASGIAAVVLRETMLDTLYPVSDVVTQLQLKWW